MKYTAYAALYTVFVVLLAGTASAESGVLTRFDTKLVDSVMITTTTAPCPDVEWKIEDCIVRGFGYGITKDQAGCDSVYCTYDMTSTTQARITIPLARLATTTTTSRVQCPDVNAAIKECAAKGMGYARYVTGACTLIRCAEQTTTTQAEGCPDAQEEMEACKEKGGIISRRYDDRKCVVIDCTQPTSDCPGGQELEETIRACKAKGLEHITYEKDGCKYAECVQPSGCPSESEIDYAIRKCKSQGTGYVTYADQNGCRQVRCQEGTSCPTDDENKAMMEECRKAGKGYRMVPAGSSTYAVAYVPCYSVECVEDGRTCPSVKDDVETCRKQGLGHEYYVDANRCERARCSEKPGDCRPNCPTDDELKEIILNCKANGLSYEFYTGTPTYASLAAQSSASCRRVRCAENACQSDAEMERRVRECRQRNLGVQTYVDSSGCKAVDCTQASGCPTYEAAEDVARGCKEKKLEVEEYVDENGCKSVRCREPDGIATVECSKMIQGECIMISCSDGYLFDSCNPHGVCPQVECKRFRDDNGCVVKRCSDGSESTECPDKNPVECEDYKRDDGCVVKKCTDGREYVSCPASQGCRDYVDGNGCRVRECEDGTKERVCPDGGQDVECKVYTDEKGCEVKECTNGYRDSSCDQAGGCKERTEDGCKIVECADKTTRKCPEDETVECKTYMSDDGCKVTVCTDGREDKACPTALAGKPGNARDSARLPTTTTLPNEGGGWLSSFLRSVGL